jgi:hypothetical protein
MLRSGATTLSITTLSIMTLSIMTLGIMILSLMALSINGTQHNHINIMTLSSTMTLSVIISA